MSLFFILTLIDRWWGLWPSYESQPFRNEDPFTSYFEWKGVCHQHRYIKKRDSISTHQIQCNTIFILIQRYIKHWLNVIIWFFFFLLFLISIIELLLTRYVLSVLIKGSIYCAHELLESGAKTRNFHFEKNYEKWCSKICSLCFFLSTCYCKIQMYTETIRQTSLGFFLQKNCILMVTLNWGSLGSAIEVEILWRKWFLLMSNTILIIYLSLRSCIHKKKISTWNLILAVGEKNELLIILMLFEQ